MAIDAFAGYLVRLEREDGLGRMGIRRKSDGAEHAVSFDPELMSSVYRRIRTRLPDRPVRRFIAVHAATDIRLRPGVARAGPAPDATDPGGHDPDLCRAAAVRHHRRQERCRSPSAPERQRSTGPRRVPRRIRRLRRNFTTTFDGNVLSLVDRGFVYAIAHVRGGIERGERWRNAGRRENKPNTFTDFIAVAEHFIKEGYTARGRIVAPRRLRGRPAYRRCRQYAARSVRRHVARFQTWMHSTPCSTRRCR